MIKRVCGAIIKGNSILMVRHQHGTHDYWTLPGGGIESGETPGQAIVREVEEEVGLTVEPIRLLFEKEFLTEIAETTEKCFLLKTLDSREPTLGYDPELDQEHQILKEVAWFSLSGMRNDIQVREVIASLDMKEKH